jgi:hypothetical protein
MSEGSVRRGSRPIAGPLLLAVIFLAVLGAGAGFSLGTLAKGAHTEPTTSNSPLVRPSAADTSAADTSNAAGGNGGGPADTTTGGTGNTNQHQDSTSCPQHTVDLAKDGALTLVLYLHTNESEVWVCMASDGTLFYQGHAGPPGQQLVERRNALYLVTIEREGDAGYVATNTDPDNGHQTKYHVTKDKLVKEYLGFASPKPDETEWAVG